MVCCLLLSLFRPPVLSSDRPNSQADRGFASPIIGDGVRFRESHWDKDSEWESVLEKDTPKRQEKNKLKNNDKNSVE